MPEELARASQTNNVLPPPGATGAAVVNRDSFQTSTSPLAMGPVVGPDAVTLLAANRAPAYSSFVASGASSSLGAGSSASPSAWMLPPLAPRQSSSEELAAVRRSGGEQAGAEEEEVMTEEDADEEEGPELTLGNAEALKDRA